MEFLNRGASKLVAAVPAFFSGLRELLIDFFVLKLYQLLLASKTASAASLRTGSDRDRASQEQSKVVAAPHRFPWSSVITVQSIPGSSSSCTDESIVESGFCQSSLHHADRVPPHAAPAHLDKQTQTDPPPLTAAALRPLIKQAIHRLLDEYQFYYKCSKCRRAFFDSLVRNCQICQMYLCFSCEKTHNITHPIAYVKRRGQL